MIPAGPLREPVAQGLARADAVIVDGRWHAGPAGLSRPGAARPSGRRRRGLRGQRVFAFAGIGRPEKFVASLEAAGAHRHRQLFFRRPSSLFATTRSPRSRRSPATRMLVTTEKDFVRLTTRAARRHQVLKVAAVFDDTAAMERLA